MKRDIWEQTKYEKNRLLQMDRKRAQEWYKEKKTKVYYLKKKENSCVILVLWPRVLHNV